MNRKEKDFTPPQKKSLKHSFIALVFALGFGSGYLFYESNLAIVPSITEQTPIMKVCFSPEGRCEKLAIKLIASAQKEILVQCYSFTSNPIASALIEAHKKGVVVKVLFDRSQLKAPYSQIHRLIDKGIIAKVDKVPGIAHNKIIISDGAELVTGSYNFSKAANVRNAENMLLIKDLGLVKTYREQWHKRFSR